VIAICTYLCFDFLFDVCHRSMIYLGKFILFGQAFLLTDTSAQAHTQVLSPSLA